MKAIFLMFLFLSGGLLPQAQADTIYLKNGHSMEGIIAKETDEYVALSVGIGTVTFYHWQIDNVVHAGRDENDGLQQRWDDERLRKESELEKLKKEIEKAPKEIGVERKGNHFFLDALLNGKIKAALMLDTGASFVVLSPRKAAELGIDIKKIAPDAKMVIADGREVSAKLLTLNTISVQNVEAKDVDAVVLFTDESFEGFDGLLGMSFLKLFKFELDLERNKLILQKP